MLDQVKNTIEKYNMLTQKDKIIIGVSGGPDSVALLYILSLLKQKYQLKLWVVHVNHMFRGEEAKKEAQFVADLAEKWDIPYKVFARDIPALIKSEGLSPQDAGHRVRKEIYNKVREETGANKLALGHHADDRAETVLLHLIQGTGLDGLASMPPKHDWIIRPLAQVSKEDVIKFCHDKKLTYCLDPSNNKAVYLRNKIRLNLMPYLKKEFNPQMVDNLLKLEDIVTEENNYLEKQADNLLKDIIMTDSVGKISLDTKVFNTLHRAMQRRIIRKVFKRLRPVEQNLAYTNVEQVIDICEDQKGTKELHLPKSILVKKAYANLEFLDVEKHHQDKQIKTEFFYEWDISRALKMPIPKMILNGFYTSEMPKTARDFTKVVLDGSTIKLPLVVRNRKPGDRIQPLGMSGTKKLKDLYIDKKIEKDKRDLVPVVCSGDDIIWLPGLTINNNYKVTSCTNCYLVLELVKGEYV